MYCILLDWRFLVMLWNLCLPSFFRLRCSASRQRHLLFPQCLSKTTSHWCLFWPHGWWRNAIWSWEVLYWVTREGLLHTLVSLTACHDVTISYCSHISSAHGRSVEWYRELVLSPISDTQYLCFAYWLVTATLTCLAVLECFWSTEVVYSVRWFPHCVGRLAA